MLKYFKRSPKLSLFVENNVENLKSTFVVIRFFSFAHVQNSLNVSRIN